MSVEFMEKNGLTSPGLTSVLGQGDHLGQQLGKIGEIVAEEAGLKDEGFPTVRSGQLTTQELGFAGNTKGRSALGVLQITN